MEAGSTLALRAGACAWTLALWLAVPSVAHASDLAAAEALFHEGKRLFEAGEIAPACEKFAESQRLDASPGTLLNLARCHETEGKVATAWAEYLEAKRSAAAEGREQIAATAARRAAALEPRLSYLVIVAPAKVQGLVVTRGGERLEHAALGTRLPVDAGSHRVEASAPGYEPWVAEVAVGEGGIEELRIPPLAPAARATESQPPATTLPPASSSTAAVSSTIDARPRRGPPVLAYVVGGVGVAALGAGAVFALLAKNEYDDAAELCPSRTGCSDRALSARSDADTFANVANVAVPVGLVGVAAGVVLWLTHPSERAAGSGPVQAGAGWVPGGVTGSLRGSF